MTESSVSVILSVVPRIPFDLVPFDRTAAGAASPLGFRPARRSLVACALLAVGYVVARGLPDSSALIWFGVAGACTAVALISTKWVCKIALMLAVLAFGGGWFSWRVHATLDHMHRDVATIAGRSDSLSTPLWLEPVLVKASGVVTDTPAVSQPPRGSLASFFRTGASIRFTVRLTSLSGPAGEQPSNWRVQVVLPAEEADPVRRLIRAGDPIRLSGHLSLNAPPLNPGEADRQLIGAAQGTIGRLRAPSASLIERAEAPTGISRIVSISSRLTEAARHRARHALDAIIGDQAHPDRAASDPGRALLAAMLLGEREAGYDDAEGAFRRLGLVHLVAISGFNLAILAGLILFLVRLTGDRGRLEPIAAALVILAYMILVPGEAPIIRSGITLLVFLATEAIGTRYDRLTLLGWTAIGLLLWRPMDAWSLGFQLSFGIVAVLLWLTERTNARLFGVELAGAIAPRRSGLWGTLSDAATFISLHLRTLISTSLLAWCAAMPLIAHHTGVVSPLAVLTTLVVLPLTVAVLWAGYIALLVGVIWPGAGSATGGFLTSLSNLLVRVVIRLDDIPGMSFSIPYVSGAWALVATAAVMVWFRFWRVRQRGAILASLLVLAWLGVQLRAAYVRPADHLLQIDTLAVGDATCHLIRSGDQAMLWDCGSQSPGFGVTTLPRITRALGAARIHTAVITHANLDHFGNIVDAVETLGIKRIFVCRELIESAQSRPDTAAGVMLTKLDRLGVRVESAAAGDELEFGLATLRFAWPPQNAPSFENVNDSSLVGIFYARGDSAHALALLTGDIGPLAMRGVRDLDPSLTAPVLEAPHHGSFNHESAAFIHAVNPAVVLQSTGRQRAADPRWDTARTKHHWFCTAVDGSIATVIHRDGTVRVAPFLTRPSQRD